MPISHIRVLIPTSTFGSGLQLSAHGHLGRHQVGGPVVGSCHPHGRFRLNFWLQIQPRQAACSCKAGTAMKEMFGLSRPHFTGSLPSRCLLKDSNPGMLFKISSTCFHSLSSCYEAGSGERCSMCLRLLQGTSRRRPAHAAVGISL